MQLAPESSGPGPYVPLTSPGDSTGEADSASLVLEYQAPPIDRLPPPLGEYVAKSAEAIGCDPCLVAMSALAACAAAIGDSRAVQVKSGWIEFPILWTLAVAPSGAFKTPAMKAAMEGLEEAQRIAFDAHRLAEARHKDDLARWQTSDKQGTEPTPPTLASYYTGDATLEAIGTLLDANPRGLLQKRYELSGWLGSFDRYSEGNEAAQWLEFHSGNAVRIDRKGGEKKTIYIPRALVSVTGTIQEPVLRKLLTGDDAKHFDNGLAARFLMAMPPERTREWREAVTPPELLKQYVSLARDLLALDHHRRSEGVGWLLLPLSHDSAAREMNPIRPTGRITQQGQAMKSSELVFIGIKGSVVALDRVTDAQVWATHLKGYNFVNVVVEDGRLFATCCGEIFCLDPLTGNALLDMRRPRVALILSLGGLVVAVIGFRLCGVPIQELF